MDYEYGTASVHSFNEGLGRGGEEEQLDVGDLSGGAGVRGSDDVDDPPMGIAVDEKLNRRDFRHLRDAYDDRADLDFQMGLVDDDDDDDE